jgi:hypothetical protein
MKHLKNFIFSAMLALLPLFLCILTGCGTTTKVLSSDEQTSAEITNASSGRIARIEVRDSASEFGSDIVINPSTTQWVTASIVRREFNEINVFHASDSWKFTEGSALHTAIPTNMIRSITIPADMLVTGIVIGGVAGALLGAGLAALINTSTSNLNGASSPSFNTFVIIEAALLAFAGAALGGEIGATHQTMYIR